MPFWWQQLREEISPAQVIPDWGLSSPLDPASIATSQDIGQRHAQTHDPPQKCVQSVVNGDTGRWTVPRDALAPLGRSPRPRPGKWNVHRDTLVPLGRSPLLPRTPAQPYESCSNDRTRFQPPARVLDMSSVLRVDGVVARKKTSFIVDTGATFSLLTSFSGPTQDSELTIKGFSGVPLRPKVSPPLLC